MVYIENIRSTFTRWVASARKLGLGYIGALVAVIALFIAVIALVFLTIQPYLKSRTLTENLAEAEADLERLQKLEAVNLENLTSQVNAAQQDLDAAYNVFPDTASAAEVLDTIYGLAAESGVSVSELQGLGTESGEEGDIEVTRYSLQASGPATALSSFLARVQTETVGTITLNDVQVSGAGPQYDLAMQVVIYSSPLSSGPGQGMPTPAPVGTPTPTPPSLSPEDLTALTQQLDAAVTAGNWPLAIDLAQQVQTADPAHPGINDTLYDAYVKYGSDLLVQGQLDEASTQFNEALTIRPDGPEAQQGLAQALALPPTATPVPPPSPTPSVEQALEQAKVDADWEEVLRLLFQIQSSDPEREGLDEQIYEARVNYGDQLINAGSYEEAKQQFEEALRLAQRLQFDASEALAGLQRLEAIAGGVVVPTPTGTAVAGLTPTPIAGNVYVVVRGDNLYRIALRFNTTVDAIMKANGLTSSNIYVGQTLTIPGPGVPPAPTGQVHIVQTGDTLYSIARRYGTTVDAIMSANGLTSTTIYVGQQLIIPGR